jgi:hypothetical protein
MSILYFNNRLEIKNVDNLKYIIVEKYTEENIYEPLLSVCDEISKELKKNKDDYNIYDPIFWTYPSGHINNEKMKISINIDFSKNFMKYNDNIIPTFLDFNKLAIDNKIIRNDHNVRQYHLKNLFEELINDKLKKQKKINYLSYRIGFEHSEKWDNMVLEIIKNKNAKIKTFSISFDEGNEKTKFFISPYLINSDFEDLRNIKENIKFDIGYILLRKNSDIFSLKSDIQYERFIYIMNFLCNHSNINASYIISFGGAYNNKFENLICSLSLYFETVILKTLNYENSSSLTFFIMCKQFKNIKCIDLFEKRNYSDELSRQIKNNVFTFRNNLLISKINYFYYLESNIKNNFNLNIFKNNIINYITENNLPLNILYNKILENNNLHYHDMQLLIDVLNNNNIDIINEKNMKINTFLYITGLYNELYNKKYKYNIINPELNINDYLEIYSLPIKINYNNKTKSKKSLIIYNNVYEFEKADYVLIKKDISLPFINYFFIYKKGKDYYLLKKL